MFIEQIISKAYSLDIVRSKEQTLLTEEHVTQSITELMDLATKARDEFDAEFLKNSAKDKKASTPSIYGEMDAKDYPAGYCREISDAVYEKLSSTEFVANLIKNGIVFKRVYVILNNTYFQNAIQCGDYFIDISNDTVDPSKDRIYYLNIKDLSYGNFENYEQYYKIAETYLNLRFYPNIMAPSIYNYYPVVALDANGRCNLFNHQEIILYKDISLNFKLSEEFKKSYFFKRKLPENYRETLKYFSSHVEIFMGSVKNIVNAYHSAEGGRKALISDMFQQEVNFNLNQLPLLLAFTQPKLPENHLETLRKHSFIPEHRR